MSETPTQVNESNRSAEAIEGMAHGSLPPEQEALLAQAGYDDYVIGVNQSGARSGQEALQVVADQRGISVGGWDIGQHFILHDKASVREWEGSKIAKLDLEQGYTRDSSNYRFVVAFPIHPDTRAERQETTAMTFGADYAGGIHPPDIYVDIPAGANQAERRSITARYIAGYIDENQMYHGNPGFMAPNQEGAV